MKTTLTITLLFIIFFFFQAEDGIRDISFDLPDFTSEIDFSEPNAIGPEEVMQIFTRLMEVGGQLFKIFSNIWTQFALFLENVTGMQIGELGQALFSVAINTIEIILNLIRQVASAL